MHVRLKIISDIIGLRTYGSNLARVTIAGFVTVQHTQVDNAGLHVPVITLT